MSKTVVIAAGLAASLSILAGGASAQGGANDFAYLDLAGAQSPAEQLVVCDQTRLFNKAPDPFATRVYQKIDETRFELALPPDYTRPSGWYDSEVERAHEYLQRRGLISRTEVAAARSRYPARHLTRTELPVGVEKAFLRRQSRACASVLRGMSGG